MPEQTTSKPTIIEAEELTVENVKKHWKDIVQRVPAPHVRMSLKNGWISEVQGNRITVTFGSAFHREKVAETAGSRSIEDILQAIFKRPIQIDCVIEKGKDGMVAEAPSADLLLAAAEVFGSTL